MTNEELDEARAKEAKRLWGSNIWSPGDVSAVANIAARLARENWTPPEPVVDPDVLAFRKWFAGYDPNIKKLALTGKWDESQFSRAYLAGARMAREREQERVKVLVKFVERYSGPRAAVALAKYRGEA